jgi:hypothetical protein
MKGTQMSNPNNIKVGQNIMFKDGHEQYGKVVNIIGGLATVRVYDSDTGKASSRSVSISRCYADD